MRIGLGPFIQDSLVQPITFSVPLWSGDKIYSANFSGDIYQYSMSTPYDLTTVSYDNKVLNTGLNQLISPRLSTDGTKLLFARTGFQTTVEGLYSYTLSTAWDITTATQSSAISLNGIKESVSGFDMRPDGKMVLAMSTANDPVSGIDDLITTWELTTPYDVSTITNRKDKSLSAQMNIGRGCCFKYDNGTKFWVLADDGCIVYEYEMSTPWDITSATYSGNNFNLPDPTLSKSAFIMDNAGSTFYVTNRSNGIIEQYDMTTPYDITTASLTDTFDDSTRTGTDLRGLALGT